MRVDSSKQKRKRKRKRKRKQQPSFVARGSLPVPRKLLSAGVDLDPEFEQERLLQMEALKAKLTRLIADGKAETAIDHVLSLFLDMGRENDRLSWRVLQAVRYRFGRRTEQLSPQVLPRTLADGQSRQQDDGHHGQCNGSRTRVMRKRPRGVGTAGAWVGSERLALGGVVQGARVLEQEPVAIDGVEQRHGALDDAVCEAVAGQGIVIELVFDGRMGGTQGDDGDLGGVGKQVEAADLRALTQLGRAESIADHTGPPAGPSAFSTAKMMSRSTSLRFLRAARRSALWAMRSTSRRDPEAASWRRAMASEVKSSLVQATAVSRRRM